MHLFIYLYVSHFKSSITAAGPSLKDRGASARLSTSWQANPKNVEESMVMGDCGSVGSRSVFQSGGWRFNPRPSRCVLEQDTELLPVAASAVYDCNRIVSRFG